MRERFERAWAERVHRARAWQRDEDPTPALEVLAMAVVRALVGEEGSVGDEERRVLLDLAPRALNAGRELAMAAVEGTDRDDWLGAVALAELGVRVLRGDVIDWARATAGAPADLTEPPPRRLAAAVDGRLDGFSAAACALYCLSTDPSEARLLWRMGSQLDVGSRRASEPVLVAAAEPEPLRAPDAGSVAGVHEGAGVEAVWFASERELALYADRDVYVSFAAPGVRTRNLRTGYWLGTVDAGAGPDLAGELEVDGQTFRWSITLPAG